MVRPNVPPLTGQRRRQPVPRVKEIAEEARIAIRNIRRDANKHADHAEKDKVLSEDLRDQTKDAIQDLTKKYEGQINNEAAAKVTDVLEE